MADIAPTRVWSTLVIFEAPSSVSLHCRRPLQRIAPGPLPRPALPNEDDIADLMPAKNVPDLMQSSGVATSGSNRRDFDLSEEIAAPTLCALHDPTGDLVRLA